MISVRAYKFLFTGLVVAMMGCSDRSSPTEPAAGEGSGLTSQTGASSIFANVSGPDVIYSSTPSLYTFTASANLIEPTYDWYSRYCDTPDVDSCNSTWNWFAVASVGTGQSSSKTRNLGGDCSGDGTRSFQVMVEAKGWYSLTYTATHVTRLCPSESEV